MEQSTYSLLVFAQCRVDDTGVEEDLGRVGNELEGLERDLEFIVIVVDKSSHPRLNFLRRPVSPVQRIT